MAEELRNCWPKLGDAGREAAFALAEDYKAFLNEARTERLAVRAAEREARARGFAPLEERETLSPGDRVYAVNRGRAMILAVIGQAALEEGLNIVGAHVDSPRLDLKPEPLYQDEELVLFKTHYYGGIRKYHWFGIPLMLVGTVVRADGEVVHLGIGDRPGEPVFTVTDLLPHLAKDQKEKKLEDAFPGENLNILAGSIPARDDGGKPERAVKQAILAHLQQAYGITEEDFISAELQAVPAWPAADIGFDRGLVGGYGQDDRSCAFAALRAILEVERPARTAVVLLADKEEIGSMGNTGMHSRFLENTLAEIMARSGTPYSGLKLRRMMARSRALSADVNAGLDPTYPEVMDKRNAARIGGGVCLTRYTGSRGKAGGSEASAEFVGAVRALFKAHNVCWQTGELGKVDQGGGGTIAYLLAMYGMDVLDCGPALLGMHSPFEVMSKADLYASYRGYKVFLEASWA